jgi:hypothetical protein
MTEHGFLAAMLALVAAEVLVLGLVLGSMAYRVYKKSEQIEGVTAAIYLEARKILTQIR